jgi:hypothetical protein
MLSEKPKRDTPIRKAQGSNWEDIRKTPTTLDNIKAWIKGHK